MDYSSNESYGCSFDAGVNKTWSIQFNSFRFEHSDTNLWDRLGIQTSTDGTTWTNVQVSWMHTSSTSTHPYANTFGGGGNFNDTASKNGWILPATVAIAVQLGWDVLSGITAPRYVRFTFSSDGSVQFAGWHISLQSV